MREGPEEMSYNSLAHTMGVVILGVIAVLGTAALVAGVWLFMLFNASPHI